MIETDHPVLSSEVVITRPRGSIAGLRPATSRGIADVAGDGCVPSIAGRASRHHSRPTRKATRSALTPQVELRGYTRSVRARERFPNPWRKPSAGGLLHLGDRPDHVRRRQRGTEANACQAQSSH
jgi:hypothetical protein